MNIPHVVIVGGGFGGLTAARALKKTQVRITLIDRSNHHLFQPLLYQVATAGLSPADIAAPIRGVLSHQKNAEVLMADVIGLKPKEKTVLMKDRQIQYDSLILATGSSPSYFNHPEWRKFAPGLKSIIDATRIRRNILLAFEAAEMEQDLEKRKALLTFVLVGAGPTGVEMAGSIAELAHQALRSDFRHIDPRLTRIILVEANQRILMSFPEDLAAKAHRKLLSLGVEVHTGIRVENVDALGVILAGAHIPAKTIIWSAGVVASPAGKWLHCEMDRAGRVCVMPDLTVPGHPEIFVIGDTAYLIQDGKALPGVAPVAMQQGRYVAKVIKKRLSGRKNIQPFQYINKGNLATVGRSFAIADLGKIKLSGHIAWLAWLIVHIYYLIGFRNRILVVIEWAWAYFTFQRGARLITLDDRRA
jgi:NADH:ubiquinone reductase (H+-translocating)